VVTGWLASRERGILDPGVEAKECKMRVFPLSGVVAVVLSSAAPAAMVEESTLDAIVLLAAQGYKAPESAEIRNVHKSLARNGLGYCGEISVEAGEGFTVFHVVLADEDGAGASVLRLADYPVEDRSRNAVAVRGMMRNFGCVAAEVPPAPEPDTR
jgi:hypothetical protein